MGELSELKGRMRALRNVKKVKLVNLPKLTVMVLCFAFVNVKEMEMENASLLEGYEAFSEAERKRREEEDRRIKENEERQRKEKEERKKKRKEWCINALIWCLKALGRVICCVIPCLIIWYVLHLIIEFGSYLISLLPAPETEQQRKIRVLQQCVGIRVWENMTELVVPSSRCNSELFNRLDFRVLPKLRSIVIGDECFENVEVVILMGLKQLERVVIGKRSFTKYKHSWNYDINRKFFLMDCEKLRELKIGRRSFSDYSVCEIENVPSLEVIKIGRRNEASANFYYASLELKSDSQRMK